MQFIRDFRKMAISYDGKEYSYADLLRHSGDFSKAITPFVKNINSVSSMGDRIAIVSENRPEWAFSFYGIWKSGGIAIPVDFMSTPDEIRHIIDDSTPSLMIVSRGTESLVKEAIGKASHKPSVLILDDVSLSENSAAEEFPDSESEAVSVIIYTSGTTGTPKGVMLTYGNIWSIIEVLATDKYDSNGIMFSPEENYIAILPFHHIYPLEGTLLGPLSAGSSVCMIKELTADSIFDTCQKYRITRILGVPRLYAMFHKGIVSQINKSAAARILLSLSRAIGSRRFGKLIFGAVQNKFGGNINALMSGGSKLDVQVAKDFRAMGFRVLEGYGMTETSPSMTMCDLKSFQLGSVGYLVPCGEVKLIDEEFCYKGPNVMKGYYNRPAETAAVFDSEGWFHTGDKASIDRKGFIRITGRIKEMIVLPNGKNVNPEEIENEMLRDFTIVKDVGVIEKEGKLFAVVFPDFAKIKTDSVINIKETIKWEVIDRYNVKAAHHKKILDFTIVETELPRTRVGKLKRFALNEMVGQNKPEKEAVKEPEFEEYLILKEAIEGMHGSPVRAGDHLELDLNMDSLDRVELQVRVEGNFGIKLSNEDISHYPRVCDLAEFIRTARTKVENEKTDWSAILNQDLDFSVPKSNFMMNLFLLVLKPLFLFYFRVKAVGLEKIPAGTPVIFAPNHQSFLDGLVLSGQLNRKMRSKTFFFAKDRNFDSGFLRFFARNANIILLNINRDLKETLQKMAAISRTGNNIAIFPEGARTRDGKIMHFKKSFAILSRELNVPVVPVVIHGTFELFSIGSKIPHPGDITIEFLDPIYPKDQNYEQIVEKTYKAIVDKF